MSRPPVLAALLAVLPVAALATDPPAAGTPAAAEAPAATSDEPLICRGGTRTVGSHLRSRRRCKTAAQWQAEDEAGGRLPVGMQVTEGQNDGHVTQQPR